ncbi:uncharacterized protein LOC135500729 [Lineus longissimus]|uniref:uncharacterized protein LOC135500729 n=1 Tax=Lineus longissimus TaxID=88925 RepID=UPI002B4F93D2
MLSKFFLVIFGCLYVRRCTGATCVTNSPCSCTYDDGSGTVDISSLGNTDGNPRLKDEIGTADSAKYSYNPCTSFTEHECKDVAVCYIINNTERDYYIPAGMQPTAKFGMSGADLDITYTTADDAKTIVTLKCDKTVTGEPKWEVLGKPPQATNMLITMTHNCNCPNACSAGAAMALSIGSILCIILLVGLVVYFGFGALFLFFVKKESGVNVVPNHTFWTGLPGQIQDGGKFVIGSITKKRGEYSEI